MALKFKEYPGKPDKNRLINAMKGEPVDRVPNFEIFIAAEIVEQILGRNIGSSAIGFFENTEAEQNGQTDKFPNQDFRPVHAADYIELCKAIGQDAIAIGSWNAPFFITNEQGELDLAKGRKFKNREDIKLRISLIFMLSKSLVIRFSLPPAGERWRKATERGLFSGKVYIS